MRRGMYGALSLVLLLTACDVTIELDVDLEDVCALFQQPPSSTLPVPREAGEPCNGMQVCGEELLCFCGVCVDPDVVTE